MLRNTDAFDLSVAFVTYFPKIIDIRQLRNVFCRKLTRSKIPLVYSCQAIVT